MWTYGLELSNIDENNLSKSISYILQEFIGKPNTNDNCVKMEGVIREYVGNTYNIDSEVYGLNDSELKIYLLLEEN